MSHICHRWFHPVLLLTLCLCSPTQILLAQPARTPDSLEGPARSPVVHEDGRVTFRFKASQARKVEVVTQFTQGNQTMTAGPDEFWSVTLGPATPDLYPYHFVVDGISVADPLNPDVFPNEKFKSSLVDIPADPPAVHAIRDVPHGEVTYAFYFSKLLNCSRPLVIYTPPGYRGSTESYPVLYLVSGTTDTEETWVKAGRANFILDNLLAERKAVPMILVMPYGNMLSGTPPPSSREAAAMYQKFSEELVSGIFPYVESQYRVRPGREHRAIAGFSRGGGQSLFTGFLHPDKFAWIGSYSAYLTPEVFTNFFAPLADHADATNEQLKLLWLGVGKQDFLYKQAMEFEQFLTAKSLRHTSLVTEGGHTWMNARHYLTETLQLYFR